MKHGNKHEMTAIGAGRERTLTRSLPSENNLTGTRSPMETAKRSRSVILMVMTCLRDHVFGDEESVECFARMAGGEREMRPVENRSM
jgi:hypothetical protein